MCRATDEAILLTAKSKQKMILKIKQIVTFQRVLAVFILLVLIVLAINSVSGSQILSVG